MPDAKLTQGNGPSEEDKLKKKLADEQAAAAAATNADRNVEKVSAEKNKDDDAERSAEKTSTESKNDNKNNNPSQGKQLPHESMNIWDLAASIGFGVTTEIGMKVFGNKLFNMGAREVIKKGTKEERARLEKNDKQARKQMKQAYDMGKQAGKEKAKLDPRPIEAIEQALSDAKGKRNEAQTELNNAKRDFDHWIEKAEGGVRGMPSGEISQRIKNRGLAEALDFVQKDPATIQSVKDNLSQSATKLEAARKKVESAEKEYATEKKCFKSRMALIQGISNEKAKHLKADEKQRFDTAIRTVRSGELGKKISDNQEKLEAAKAKKAAIPLYKRLYSDENKNLNEEIKSLKQEAQSLQEEFKQEVQSVKDDISVDAKKVSLESTGSPNPRGYGDAHSDVPQAGEAAVHNSDPDQSVPVAPTDVSDLAAQTQKMNLSESPPAHVHQVRSEQTELTESEVLPPPPGYEDAKDSTPGPGPGSP